MLPDEVRAGQALTARLLNAMLDELERLGKIETVPPLGHEDGPGGFTFWVDAPRRFWIRLLEHGADGQYAWERVTPVAGGGWETALGNQQGTTTDDPAIELNGNETIDLDPEPVVWAWRERVTNDLRFQFGSC